MSIIISWKNKPLTQKRYEKLKKESISGLIDDLNYKVSNIMMETGQEMAPQKIRNLSMISDLV